MVPRMAQTMTMMASAIMPFGKFLAGFSTLFTYGEIFSHPPTANTRIDSDVKYCTLNCGMMFSQLQSMLEKLAAGLIAGAANIIRM